MGKFGDKFRKERERQAMKLEDVSNSTKISARMLRAIEEEHFDQLPGGVFNRGFIRAYAKHLGLDEEEAVATYLASSTPQNRPPIVTENRAAQLDRRTPNSGERWYGQDRRTNDRRVDDRRNNDRRNNQRRLQERRYSSASETDELPDLQLPKAEHIRPKRTLAVHSDAGARWQFPALVALLIVAALLWWSHSRNARVNASSRAAAVAPSPLIPSPASASPAVAEPVAGNVAPVAPSPPHSTLKVVSHPVSAETSPNSAAPKREDAAPAASDSAAAPPAPPKPRANLTLIIRASENSWISVTADGQPVVQETLIAPAHTSVRAAREIIVRAGNAGGVTFALNGEEFPAQGAEGEAKTLVFGASGLLTAAPINPAATPAPSAGPVP